MSTTTPTNASAATGLERQPVVFSMQGEDYALGG